MSQLEIVAFTHHPLDRDWNVLCLCCHSIAERRVNACNMSVPLCLDHFDKFLKEEDIRWSRAEKELKERMVEHLNSMKSRKEAP